MNEAEMSTNPHVLRGGTAERSLKPCRLTPMCAGQGGFTIIEVLVSAVITVLIATAAFGAIQSAGRTASETKHHTQAYGIAQQDQARLRTFKISDLSNYAEDRTVTVDGTPYAIHSTGEFVTDSTGTQSCAGSASADYISIGSTVTWPSIGSRPPVIIKSIVSPPNGTIGEDRGALSVKAVDSRNNPLAGLTISGTGPDTFSDTTDANGCVLFGNLPAGNYTLTPSSALTLVNKDGAAPAAQTSSVVAQATNSVTMQYDRPGTANITFRTRQYPPMPATPAPIPTPLVATSLVASKMDTIVAYNTGMAAPRAYGTLGTRVSTVAATGLFPFTSTYSFYAGKNCAGDTPPTGAALGTLTVPVNGTITTSPALQMPALWLTVWDGTATATPGLPVNAAHVIVTDKGSGCANVKRTFTTNATGRLPDPGMPYSTYDVCADNGVKKVTVAGVSVKNLSTATAVEIFLGSASAVAGVCT